jgi:hypothetical protein
MIKDLLVSFKESVKSKSSNPFLGTYAVIWVIRNWRLVYSFFFFDSKTTLAERISILATYYTYKTFISDLLWNILWALGALILTYLLINLSRLIVNLFEKKLTPLIYKITDINSIVLKITHDSLKSDKQDLEIKLEEERDRKGKMQKEISTLEERIQEMTLSNSAVKNETKEINEIFDIIKQDKSLKMAIGILQSYIQKGSPGILEKLSNTDLSFFQSRNLIELKKNGEFNWTKKGVVLNERMSNTTTWDGELGPK